MDCVVPVSIIIPTFNRAGRLLNTLKHIEALRPAPAEVLVYVDDGDTETAKVLAANKPGVKVVLGVSRLGPGGGRNLLVEAAQCELLASFDDDSYPLDADYFVRAMDLAERFRDFDLFAAASYMRGEEPRAARRTMSECVAFENCGVVFRRTAFLRTKGYLPLERAYGMEEADVALQLMDKGSRLMRSEWLRVRHDTDFAHHRDSEHIAAQIANTALLVWLRCPFPYALAAPAKAINRALWCVRKGHPRGTLAGLAAIPATFWKYRRFRQPVSRATMRQFFRIRSRPERAEF